MSSTGIFILHLKKVSVVLLNLGLVVHPDFHPKAFLLAVSAHGIPVVSLVNLSVLQFPGLNSISNEDMK